MLHNLSLQAVLSRQRGTKTQHLYVVSPTNLQYSRVSAELRLSRQRCFDEVLRSRRSFDGSLSDSEGSDGPESRDFMVAISPPPT